MISRAEVDKLLDVRAAGPSLLSLYVQVPLDPAELRGLPGPTPASCSRSPPATPPASRPQSGSGRPTRGLSAGCWPPGLFSSGPLK